eukprot:scaffold26528_cov57-Phaeocystis_antarctica.AAC.2
MESAAEETATHPRRASPAWRRPHRPCRATRAASAATRRAASAAWAHRGAPTAQRSGAARRGHRPLLPRRAGATWRTGRWRGACRLGRRRSRHSLHRSPAASQKRRPEPAPLPAPRPPPRRSQHRRSA